MHSATQTIYDYFLQNNIRCRAEENDTLSFVEAGFSGKNVTNLVVRFLSADEDFDVAVRTAPIARVPEERKDTVLQVLNECNLTYRYVKFAMNSERDILAFFDFPVKTSTENLGPVAREIFIRFMQIIDKCYPDIMKAIFAEFVL